MLIETHQLFKLINGAGCLQKGYNIAKIVGGRFKQSIIYLSVIIT